MGDGLGGVGPESEAEPHLEVLRRLVDAVGLLPDGAVDAYRRLLEAGRVPVGVAEERIASTGVLERLEESGLAWRTGDFSPPTWTPVGPELALGAMLTLSANRFQAAAQVWVDALGLLARGSDAAGPHCELAVDMSDDSVWRHRDSRIELVLSRERTDELTGPGGVMATARSTFSSLETMIMEKPPDEAWGRPPSRVGKDRGVRFRALYDRVQLSNPVAQTVLAHSISEDEEARVREVVPLKMKLADSHTVLLPLGNTGANGALLIENPVIAGAFNELFERLWEEGTPLVVGGDGRVVEQPLVTDNGHLGEMEATVLGMLADGVTIESIARRTDTPKRTVNRHLQRIRDKLGAKTSFQAAVLATRAGWLPK